MDNKGKQENERTKQVIDFSYLTVIFPDQYDLPTRLAERLNAKGKTTKRGRAYNYQSVYQIAFLARYYDANVHEELALMRNEYLEQQARIQSIVSAAPVLTAETLT